MSEHATPRQMASVFPRTEATSAGRPKYISVDTEARIEFGLTTSVAPTDAANPPVITTPDGYTDARNGRPNRTTAKMADGDFKFRPAWGG